MMVSEARRLAMRRKHADHRHVCRCGKVVHGNGGWAGHSWACREFQTDGHDWLNRWKHNPARCHRCPDEGAGSDGG